MRILIVLLALVVVTAAAAGLSAALPTPNRTITALDLVAEHGAGRWHVVRPGENLRTIADDLYGRARAWRTIQLANDVGLYPAVGSRLWIPADQGLLSVDP